jgi:hypothetical protein
MKFLVKKVIKMIYSDGVYPLALEYVQKTDNDFDDKALEFLNSFVEKLLDRL